MVILEIETGTLIDAMTFGEITDRPSFAAPDLSEPMSALRDRCDQMRVGSGWPYPFVGDDELHLHAAPLELDREIEPEFVLALRHRLRFFNFKVAIAQHRSQGLCAKNDADAVSPQFDVLDHAKQEGPLVGWSGFENSISQVGCLGQFPFHAPARQTQGIS